MCSSCFSLGELVLYEDGNWDMSMELQPKQIPGQEEAKRQVISQEQFRQDELLSKHGRGSLFPRNKGDHIHGHDFGIAKLLWGDGKLT